LDASETSWRYNCVHDDRSDKILSTPPEPSTLSYGWLGLVLGGTTQAATLDLMGVRVSDESRGASGAQQLLVSRYKALFKVYLRRVEHGQRAA
jgi:hypothetical protein